MSDAPRVDHAGALLLVCERNFLVEVPFALSFAMVLFADA